MGSHAVLEQMGQASCRAGPRAGHTLLPIMPPPPRCSGHPDLQKEE